jgi:acetolactate synthase-1/2/3 large subunit
MVCPAAIGVQAGAPQRAGHRHRGRCLRADDDAGNVLRHPARPAVKIFILNNEWMGMVRQWQQLLHGERYSHSYSDALPDFVKLAEAYGCHGIRCDDPAKLDDAILEMINTPKPVLFDCRVEKAENCFPMIPSGAAHNEMILGKITGDEIGEAGKMLV